MQDLQLTKNFRLSEFAISADHPELAAEIEFTDFEVERVRLACAVFLQPLRDALGVPVVITSGKRTPELNVAVGGAASSDHLYRHDTGAVDFYPRGRELNDAVRFLKRHRRLFKLLLIYETCNFLHLSLPDSSGLYGRVRVVND